DRLVYAEKRIGEDAIDKLRRHGHTVQVWPEYEFDAGSVQTIKSSRNSDGERTLFAAADPRRSAYGLAE
ncbi:MAG: hypothetical protein ACKO7S_02030, partial [Actinomycetota bacterium]